MRECIGTIVSDVTGHLEMRAGGTDRSRTHQTRTVVSPPLSDCLQFVLPIDGTSELGLGNAPLVPLLIKSNGLIAQFDLKKGIDRGQLREFAVASLAFSFSSPTRASSDNTDQGARSHGGYLLPVSFLYLDGPSTATPCGTILEDQPVLYVNSSVGLPTQPGYSSSVIFALK